MSRFGLSFKKIDLHLHTPASEDFHEKNATPMKIVNKAIAEKLDAIAITDHNSGEWIDRVKDAARGTSLVVFPGVEISCPGGKGGIHLIALFDIDKGTAHVAGLLSKLGITPENQGDTKSLVNGTPKAIIDVIQDSNWQGIAIPAHVTSTKGILEDMRGQQRTEIIQHPNLIAVEASCFQKENLKRDGKRAVDLLNGNDPTYQKKLAVYQASDNPSGTSKGGHGIDGIGSRCAFFKMEDINLASLRQCFFDPDVRIRQDFEFAPKQYQRIAKVSISGGFLSEQTVHFNEGLNSIIGGKGTGKSLLVELMRFALDQPPDRAEIADDHNRKLNDQLMQGNYVELEFVDDIGNSKRLKKVFDSQNSYYEAIDYKPAQVFPVLFLSQNEIIRIAESASEQLKFIDRFFDFSMYVQNLKSVERSIAEYDRQLAESIRAVSEHARANEELATISLQLSSLESQLSHFIFSAYQIAGEKSDAIQDQVALVEIFQIVLTEAHEKIRSTEAQNVPATLVNDTTIGKNTNAIIDTQNTLLSKLDDLAMNVGTLRKQVEHEQGNWNVEFAKLRSAYDEHVRSEGSNYQELASQREIVQDRYRIAEQQLPALQRQVDDLTKVRAARDSKLDELAQIYDDYRAVRESRCRQFQQKSNGRLELRILGSTNRDVFRKRLLELKKGSFLHEPDIDAIVKKSTPREFIDLILKYQIALANAPNDASNLLNEIAQTTSVDVTKIEKLVPVLATEDKLESLLELQYMAYPQDSPEITFNVGNGKFVPLRSLSVGQKSTALLMMALSEGQMPVVIDQPEDSLDIRSIWEDICSKVRSNKTQRQFIFTTHNSNVAVASDTDNYIILEADADNGRVVHSGSMDHSPVADEVLTYMEGGNDSYHRKSTKYQTDNHLSRS